MPSSRDLLILTLLVLVQVFGLTGAQQRFFHPRPSFLGSNFREPPQQKGLRSPSPGRHHNEPQQSPAHLGPNFTDDDVVVLIGTDLQVPYPLYQQISNSFLLSQDTFVLLPNSTIITVSGYNDLNKITKADPENTKVLISSSSMIPAPIYLRIILIQPEEVTVKLPNGEILPNQIYQEQYGKKTPTTESGGQAYFSKVDKEDSFPFLVVNEAGHHVTDLSISPPSEPGSGAVDEIPESVCGPPGTIESVPHNNPAHVREVPRLWHVPHFPNSQIQEPGRWPRSLYNEYVHPQNRFRMPQSDSWRDRSDHKVLLPPGLHVMESARCGICDPSTPKSVTKVLTV